MHTFPKRQIPAGILVAATLLCAPVPLAVAQEALVLEEVIVSTCFGFWLYYTPIICYTVFCARYYT